MHELSLCHSISQIVTRAAAGRRVRSVNLQIGQLRQVVPATLEYCWALVTEATGLAGSDLVIDHVAVQLRCHDCMQTTTVGHVLVLTCSACGSGDIQVITGEEFMVTSIDLEPTVTSPDPPTLDPPVQETAHG